MTHEKFEGERVLMRIHIGESDKWHGKSLQDAIVEMLRKDGFSGVTVLRGVAGYGGSSTVDGNATAGTHTTTSSIYGTAVGADYRFSRDTLIGIAMGGAGTSFNTAQGLGGGRADLFQLGVYGRHNFGAAYIAGALAYGSPARVARILNSGGRETAPVDA